MRISKQIPAALAGAVIMTMAFAALGAAASTVIVTSTNTQGWSEAATTSGGSVDFVADAGAPGGDAALELTTDSTTAARAQYMHEAGVALADVTELHYWTKQVSGPAVADPSYQLVMCLDGGDPGTPECGFTTLVFEPYWNVTQGPVVPDTWQEWDVGAGLFWSSRTVTCPNGVVVAGAGGPPLYTLEQIEAMCPDAVVVGFGVNIGTFNPNYVVRTDLVTFNETTYDFELGPETPADGDDCKEGGWMDLAREDGSSFGNQGDCIQYVNTGR